MAKLNSTFRAVFTLRNKVAPLGTFHTKNVLKKRLLNSFIITFKKYFHKMKSSVGSNFSQFQDYCQKDDLVIGTS